jgi:magnesium transporter
MQEETASKKFVLVSYDQTAIEQLSANDLDQILAAVVDSRISWLTVNGLTEADKLLLNKLLSFFRVSLSFTEKILNETIDDFSGERKDCLYMDYEIFDGYSTDSGFKPVTGTVILGKNFLLTFDKNNVGYFDNERLKIVNEETRTQEFPVDYLFYLLVRTMITQTKTLLFVNLTQRFEDLEDRVIANPGEDFILDEIMNLRTQIRPLYDVVLRFGNLISFILEEESRFITDHARTYFERNLESDRRELWEGYRGIRNWTTQLMDIHRSNMDEKTNDILKILAIISFIFLPITFLASLYGMNFTNMPEVGWDYGYYAILGVMALISGGLLIYMRKKGWL